MIDHRLSATPFAPWVASERPPRKRPVEKASRFKSIPAPAVTILGLAGELTNTLLRNRVKQAHFDKKN